MKRQLYILTDGKEIHAARAMTYDEWMNARQDAKNATDGNLQWETLDAIPADLPVDPNQTTIKIGR